MERGERYWHFVEPHWERVDIHNGGDAFLRDFTRTPEAARNLLAAHWRQSEVRNGGLNQFFWNSTGVLLPEAAAAFEVIGMPALGTLLRRAAAFFGPNYIRDRDRRIALLNHYETSHPDAPDPFDAMDDQFYGLLREEAGGWEIVADRYAEAHGG